MYQILFLKSVKKDVSKLKSAGLFEKAAELVEVLKANPYKNPPPYEKLIGDMSGYYSRRINRQHRLVYSVDEENKTVRIIAMWSHYETL